MQSQHMFQAFNALEEPPHILTLLHRGTQYTITVPLDTLSGSKFHEVYTHKLTQLHETNTYNLTKLHKLHNDDLPRHSPFNIVGELQDLIWATCSTALGIDEINELSRYSLQDLIQPPSVHATIVKATHDDEDVSVKIIADKANSYGWDTSYRATRSTTLTNSYGWSTAPVPIQDLPVEHTLQHSQAAELLVPEDVNVETLHAQQVRTISGEKFFFKPRMDLMSPEFDREISILSTIVKLDLHKTFRVSPFRGLVLLESGVVAGMLFDWLDGWPLAEHPRLGNTNLHQKWKDEVTSTVDELHQHEITWGDVNVHNIFIDLNDDAWVIDFGGNHNVEFVDEELEETYEGDRQGIRRVFEEWLPAKAVASRDTSEV